MNRRRSRSLHRAARVPRLSLQSADRHRLAFLNACHSPLIALTFSGLEAAGLVIKLAYSRINHHQPGLAPHPHPSMLHLPQDPSSR